MSTICRRCQATYDGARCPACGTAPETTQSPRSSTHELPSSNTETLASAPSPTAMTPYPAQQRTLAVAGPPGAELSTAATQVPQPQPYPYPPPPYGYPPAVHIVVQNQINLPMPYPVGYPMAYPPPLYPIAPYGKRKDAGVATLLSFFLPGAGQLYNGQVGKGIAFLAVMLVNFILLFVGVGFVTGLVTWIWAMIDAHGSAVKINRGELLI